MAIDFSLELDIARPPAVVFAVLTDPHRLPEWQRRVVEARTMDGEPVRAGSLIREVRELRGRRIEQTVEVTRFEPPRRFALAIAEGPLPVDGEWTFRPSGAGATRLRLHAHGRARGAARLLEPLMTPVLRRQMRAQHERLKQVVEEQTPAAPDLSRSETARTAR